MPGPIGFLRHITGNEANTSRQASFRALRVPQTGLSAQLLRMETIATNIANAETTRVGGPGSGPYQRRVVRMETAAPPDGTPQYPDLLPLDPETSTDAPGSGGSTEGVSGVRATAIEIDASEGSLVYDPGHPDADALGYVRYPNVNVTDEITDLMDARRIYEANASVFQAAKLMLRRALDI